MPYFLRLLFRSLILFLLTGVPYLSNLRLFFSKHNFICIENYCFRLASKSHIYRRLYISFNNKSFIFIDDYCFNCTTKLYMYRRLLLPFYNKLYFNKHFIFLSPYNISDQHSFHRSYPRSIYSY